MRLTILRRGCDSFFGTFTYLVQALKTWWKGLCSIPRSVVGRSVVGLLGHWWTTFVLARSIVTLLLPLLLGIAFATGHHFFYASLHETVVRSNDVSRILQLSLSRQQFNLALGNTFAFLVKSCLSVAVGLAYLQLFWHSILRPHTISAIDSLFFNLSDLSTFGDRKVWWRHLALLLLSLTVWYGNRKPHHRPNIEHLLTGLI